MLIQLVIVQVVTFAAIVFALKKLLYAESVKETQRLKKLKEETALKEKELQEKIGQSESVYEQKMAAAEKDARKLHAQFEAEAKELRANILDKAKKDADNIMKAAFNAKEKIREEISVEMMHRIPALAARVFSAVLSEEVRRLAHKELVRDVIQKIKLLKKGAFQAPVEHAELMTAQSLAEADLTEIKEALCLSLGQEVALNEKKDHKVTAGIIVKLGPIIIDGSLENRMRQAERELAGSMSVVGASEIHQKEPPPASKT